MKNRRILCFVQDVPMPGGAGSPIEGKQKAFVPRFCRPHHVGPLRPAPGTVRNPIRAGAILCVTSIQPSRATPAETFAFRPARVLRNLLPRYNPRALLEIKYNRFPLYKRPVSTYPFPLTPAFLQPSASGERSDIPRPCLKKQGRRGGAFPWGGSSLPEGRTFSGYFSVRSEK